MTGVEDPVLTLSSQRHVDMASLRCTYPVTAARSLIAHSVAPVPRHFRRGFAVEQAGNVALQFGGPKVQDREQCLTAQLP